MEQFLIGIDEAGRGPLAGPVAVGLVLVQKGFNIRRAFPGVADSKKLSPQRREEIYARLVCAKKKGLVFFTVQFSSAATIDRIGISKAIARALNRGISAIIQDRPPYLCNILLDGSLLAPTTFRQKTIIRGDATEPIISLASIVAKVERDRLMQKLAKRYPGYGLDVHKGYGTKLHYKKLQQHGLSEIHRKSFIHGLAKRV